MFSSSDDKEKSSSEDNSDEKTSSSTPSNKRPREESKSSHSDPTKAPDPEEAEKFDESEFHTQVCSEFALPEEDSDVITLDPCECKEGSHVSMACGWSCDLIYGHMTVVSLKEKV